MRLEFALKANAQIFANKVHAQMIATNPAYAKSVAFGQTTAWAKPYQDRDSKGGVIGTSWYVNVKDRCLYVLSATDLAALKPMVKR